MKKKLYLVQPTYRLMDGTLVKEFPLFNYSHNLPILSAAIPDEWEKTFCLEYCDDLDLDSDASVIVITSTGYDIARAHEIAQHFRERGKIVIFGAHLDTLSDDVMKEACHSVFYGYPTKTMMAGMLSDACNRQIRPEYHFGTNIDFPFDYGVLKGKKMWFVPVLASFGCRYRCSYCCYTSVSNGAYRLRHIAHVIADLKSARSLRRPVVFLDANLFNNREYLRRLCERMIAEGLQLRWGGQSTIDIGDDPEMLQLMKRAGCHMLFFGLETLDQRNMAQLNKAFDTSQYGRQLDGIAASGIRTGALFMVGLDEDTHETFDQILEFVQGARIAVPYVHILVPVPGTPLAQRLRTEHRVHTEMFDHYRENSPRFSVPCSHAYFTPKRLAPAELERLYLNLFRRLTSIRNIMKRSLILDPMDAAIVLRMNLEARRKCRAMIRANGVGVLDTRR